MMKRVWLRGVSLGVLVALTSCDEPVEEQQVDDELAATFEDYALARVDPRAARLLVRSEGRVTLQASDRTFELELQENDLRADDYKAVDHRDGEERELAAGPITTYRGQLRDEPGSFVRLTLTDAKIEGYIVDRTGTKFFIEPASHFSRRAAADDFVIYEAASIIPKDLGQCGTTELTEAMRSAEQLISPPASNPPPGLRIVRMATDADHHYVNTAGSAAAANTEILGVINMVDGIYQAELGLTVKVTYQHTWSSPGPFSGQAPQGYLEAFRSHWNANYAHIGRDVAHIFTGQENPNLINSGLAYTDRNGPGVICRYPDFAYGYIGDIRAGGSRFVSEIYRIAAHELGHNFSAPHADDPACAGTLMNTQLYIAPGEVASFCQASRTTIINYVAGQAGCLATQQPPVGQRWPRADFDGDGKDEPTVFRPGDATWYMARNGGLASATYGQAGDRLVAGDYDGDKKTDHAVFRGNTWHILQSSNNTSTSVQFGLAGDVPAHADYDGDGKLDIAVFRPSEGNWYILQSQSGVVRTVNFGLAEDIPLPGDYDGDGKADINVWRPSNTVWYRLNSVDNGFYALQWGSPGDKPVVGDFDGDMSADITTYRPSAGTWYIRRSIDGAMSAVNWGLADDIPVVANYDGDGKDDVAVFRPSDRVWYIVNSGDGSNSFVPFGSPGDIPSQTAQH